MLKQVELYAINCDKSIWLQNMIKPRLNPVCVYNDRMYQMVCGGDSQLNGMEYYDINKDKWRMIMDMLDFDRKLQNMWISSVNPNIVFMEMLQTSHCRFNYPVDYMEIKRVDLRINNSNGHRQRNCMTIWNSLDIHNRHYLNHGQLSMMDVDDMSEYGFFRRFGCAHISL